MDESSALSCYAAAKATVLRAGYGREIDWILSRSWNEFSEVDFLREAAWVILCSGFRESIVRAVFPYISLCFFDWENAAVIAQNGELCVASAMSGFSNLRKLRAIVSISKTVSTLTFAAFRKRVMADPIVEFASLPMLGLTTAKHLAKNLGYKTSKPDRHLSRLAAVFGFNDVSAFCDHISCLSGDAVQVVDTVLWRASALEQMRTKRLVT